MQINKEIPDFNLTMIINLSDAKGVISTFSHSQNILVKVSLCKI